MFSCLFSGAFAPAPQSKCPDKFHSKAYPRPFEGILRLSVARIVSYFYVPVARILTGKMKKLQAGGRRAEQAMREAAGKGPVCPQGGAAGKGPRCPQGGVPLESGRSARKGFHWPMGRTRTPGTPRTPKTWQVLGAEHCPCISTLQVRSAANALASTLCEALANQPEDRRRKARSMRRPGCLGCPGCPGQAPVPRSGFAPFQPPARASPRLPSPRPATN